MDNCRNLRQQEARFVGRKRTRDLDRGRSGAA